MEGIIPAIETAHAFAVLDQKKFKKNDIIVFNCSGRGDKDLDTLLNISNYETPNITYILLHIIFFSCDDKKVVTIVKI